MCSLVYCSLNSGIAQVSIILQANLQVYYLHHLCTGALARDLILRGQINFICGGRTKDL